MIQLVFAVLGGWLGRYIGGVDGLVLTLVGFMIVDYLTGVACGIIDHKLNSETGFKGLIKKVVIMMLVGVAHTLDAHVLGQGAVLRTAVIFFYLANEGISLTENAAHLGLPVPQKLKDVLEQLHDKDREG